MMNDQIKFEVFDRTTGERRVEALDLPVEIGKLPHSDSFIMLAPDRATISRSHGRIERSDGHLSYVDTSSNGSKVSGAKVHNTHCLINPGDTISIEEYEICILGSQKLMLKLTDQHLSQVSELRMEPDEVCIAAELLGQLTLLAQSQDAGASDATPLLNLAFDGVAVEVSPQDTAQPPEIKINNRKVSLPARAAIFDVIQIGKCRIELLLLGQEKVVCGNPECHLLNDLPFEENCTWCGYYLAASGSFTRVTPP